MSDPAAPPRTALRTGDSFTTATGALEGPDARTVVDLCGYTHPLFAGQDPPRMIPGQVVLALMAGLLESSGRMGADVLALVGMDQIAFRAPLAPGEPLEVTAEVHDRRRTSRPDRELLELDLVGRSGDRDVVTARARFLLTTAPVTPTDPTD